MRQLVREAFSKLGWQFTTRDSHTTIAIIGSNPRTWGEKVTVVVEEDGSVAAESVCSLPWQVVDWGKNKSNLNELHGSLLAAIRNSALDPYDPSTSIDDDGTSPVDRILGTKS